jgi:hypothetical protein
MKRRKKNTKNFLLRVHRVSDVKYSTILVVRAFTLSTLEEYAARIRTSIKSNN